jgi:hypothetical protein
LSASRRHTTSGGSNGNSRRNSRMSPLSLSTTGVGMGVGAVHVVTAASAAHSMQLASSAALTATAAAMIDDANYRSDAGRAPPAVTRVSPSAKPFSWFGPVRPSSPLGSFI